MRLRVGDGGHLGTWWWDVGVEGREQRGAERCRDLSCDFLLCVQTLGLKPGCKP